MKARTLILARRKQDADAVRRTLGIAPRDACCAGTSLRPDTMDGYWPDVVVRVSGWEEGRYANYAMATINGMIAKRPVGAVEWRDIDGHGA